MDKKKLIYLALGALLILPSCSQEGPTQSVLSGDSNRIYFRSYLPAVAHTRAQVVTTDNFNTCQATCFNPDDPKLINSETEEMAPYFTDICFNKDENGLFISQDNDNAKWPGDKNELHFFAYYPSCESMKEKWGKDFFNLVNASRLSEGNPVIDYRLENFRIATEIADQKDFLTAYSTGVMEKDAESGIELKFKHQLARIELSAWGASEKYDFEIAGMRIGNPITGGNFNFCALIPTSDEAYPWQSISGHQTPVEHIFWTGEQIVRLSKSTASHASDDEAASIMGNAGPAMVIPMNERIEAWEGKGDPAIATTPYATDRLYFSILLRVKNKDKKVVYPYPNNPENMTVVYLSVEDGVVKQRLYKIDGAYYTAPEENEELLYAPADSEEICEFGWASLPVAAKWEAGKIYTYKLNYSNGIGWNDPSDPNPGEPIIERGKIPFDVSVEEWAPADDYNSNLDVPKR